MFTLSTGRAENGSSAVSYWMDFKSVLTPEQNRKFWNLFEQDRVRPDKTTGR
jgi:hypothetical protein